VIDQLKELDAGARRCIYIWLAVTTVLVVLALSVRIAGGAWLNYLATQSAEELSWNPQVQMQIRQMRQQGMPQAQITEQLMRAGEQQALGMITVMKTASTWSAVIAVAVAALLWALFVTRGLKPHERRLAIYGIVLLAVVQLVYVAAQYVFVEDTARTLDRPDAIAALQGVAPPFRVAVVDLQDPLYNLWVTSLFGLHGIECINVPADSRPAADRKLFFYTPEFSYARRWQYANARFLLGRKEMLDAMLSALGKQDQCSPFYEFDSGGARHAVYEFKQALPRVFAVGTWIVATNGSDALALMNAETIDPARAAIVTSPGIGGMTQVQFNADVVLDSYRPERIEATVTLSATGLVVMATEPGNGWHASVDGEPVKIVRCNLLHQGVLVPPGRHEVVFWFSVRHWVTRVNNWSHLALPVLIVGTIALLTVPRLRSRGLRHEPHAT
jgi:Sec-independent protein secretion pathway component TatC